MKKLACLLILLPCVAFADQAFADEILLKGGAKFTGRIDMDSAQAAAQNPSRGTQARAPAPDQALSEAAAERVLTQRSS